MSQMQRSFNSEMKYYVPSAQAMGDLGQLLSQRVMLGPVVVAAAAGILSAQSIAVAGTTTTFALSSAQTEMGPFGRNVTVVASGASTATVTVKGRDYLNQKVAEQFTVNGATPVVGKKAFKVIESITNTVTAGTTINVGYGSTFGLPYKTVSVAREYADNVVASAGTLVAPDFTDPATLTTGDPRGTYTPTTTPNGTKVIEVQCELSNFVNAANNGGLHGIKHFNA